MDSLNITLQNKTNLQTKNQIKYWSGFEKQFLVANSNSSNYNSLSLSQSVILYDIIFILYITWLDLSVKKIKNHFYSQLENFKSC